MRTRGATLVELTVVVAVMAIGAAIALPATADLIRRQRVAAVGNRVLAELMHARINAVRRNRRVVVCPSRDLLACDDGGDWSSGFIAFVESRSRPGSGEILRTVQAGDLRGLQLRSGPSRPRLVFLPDGRSAGSNLTLALCEEDVLLRQIVVSNTGRARVATPETSGNCSGEAP